MRLYYNVTTYITHLCGLWMVNTVYMLVNTNSTILNIIFLSKLIIIHFFLSLGKQL